MSPSKEPTEIAEANLPFRLDPQVGGHTLRVRSFTGEEALSKLFRFQVLACTDSHVATEHLLGQNVTFTIGLIHDQERRFLAKIASVDEFGKDADGRWQYGLELVPRLWAMTQTVRSRVFEGLDPLGIIHLVFAKSGIRIDAKTRPEDRIRPYCVQYFESDFDFIVRLLEEEGYVYHYDSDKDVPIFGIWHLPSSFDSIGKIPFHEVTGGSEERITSWKKTRILTATAVRARDHLFEAQSPILGGTASVPETDAWIPGREKLHADWSASVDRYPGDWAHLFEEVSMNGGDEPLDGYIDFGSSRAMHDLRQITGLASACEGASNCSRMKPGCVFRLTDHHSSAGEHFVISVHHKASQALNRSNDGALGFHYENQFTSIPYTSSVRYLPPRCTRKPVIHGCQTAKVVGVPGNDIWTDKYGRVQVRFWWDRHGTRSCWIRVATSWAGNGWGLQHIPRVGQEVVVTFLDGDPDRPLIIGSVYNAQHMPPFELPKNKTQSGIRTRSTLDGVPGEQNEICFEDAMGGEEIYIHAQKDRTAIVKNDSAESVGHDRFDVVAHNFHATTKGDKLEHIKGSSSLKVDGESMNDFAGNLGIRAKNIHLKAGTIVIEADEISIRSSSNDKEFIHLKKGGGITIESKGSKVWLNCGGKGEPGDGCFTDPASPDNPFEVLDPAPQDTDK